MEREDDSAVTVMRLFANSNLLERKCIAYIRQEDGGCGCGREEEWHQLNDVTRYCKYPDAETMWNSADHTELRSSKAYGEIEFPGFGTRTTASPYAKVDYETDPALLWTLLHQIWSLPTPTLVISVTGGAGRFIMKKRLEAAFKQGLIDVAATTDAWVITGGTASGITKYVGEAIQEYQFSTSQPKTLTAIGIVGWGTVANRESLIESQARGLYPAFYNLRDCKGEHPPLDHNQTHFLLPDDGTEGYWSGNEMLLRKNLELYIRTKCMACLSGYNMCQRGQQCVGTPMVLLLVEGGQNSLFQVRDAVKNQIPVVIMKETGRMADILSLAYQMTEPRAHTNEPYFNPDFVEDMSVLIGHHLKPLIQDDDIPELVHAIVLVMQHRGLLTIFDLNGETCGSMDKAVLSALLKANKSNPRSQVELAMMWNRADVAKQQIFTLENRAQWQIIDLDEIMQEAIIDGREDFVQLFMDSGGVQMERFLSVNRLYDLYSSAMDENTAISLIFKSIKHRTNMYSRLFSCGTNESETSDAYLLHTVGRIISFLLNDRVHVLYTQEMYVIDCQKQRLSNDRDFTNPEKHLLLWSLMFNRKPLARMFWKMCPDPIGGALIAGQLLKSLAKEADCHEEVDLSCELEKEANYYEELACGVLTACYNVNKPLAHQLLTRQLDMWGGATLFSLAESARFMNFMQLSCCQTKLTSLWYGMMVDHTHEWRIFVVLLFPYLVSLVRFKNLTLKAKPLIPSLGALENNGDLPEKGSRKVTSRQPSARRVSVAYGLYFRDQVIRNQSISASAAIHEFYSAPVTKFYLCAGFYLMFLGLFTMVVLSKFYPVRQLTNHNQGILEIIFWCWVIAFALEEFRQLATQEAKSTMGFKVIHYFKSFWNLLDLISLVLCISSIFLRVQQAFDADQLVRFFYSIAILLMYLRFMEFFYVSKTIGPKIIMIQKMLKDLLFFVCILAIFILSFGIAMEAMLYPDKELSMKLFFDAIYTPYWQLFGELFMDRIEGNSDPKCLNKTLRAQDDMDCPMVTRFVPLLSAIYMLLTNVLLLNLLIAMFSYTFEKVQENSEKVWRFYRYSLVHHFFEAPTIPAPLIVVNIFLRFIDYCVKKYRGTYKTVNGFKVVLSEAENLALTAFEKSGRERYLADSHRISVEQIDSRVTEAAMRINKVKEDLEEIKECLSLAVGGVKIASGTQRPMICHESGPSEKPASLLEAKLQKHSDLLNKLVETLTPHRK